MGTPEHSKTAGSAWHTYGKTYQEYKAELDTELKKTAEGFVRIGYLLKVARDTSILAESGYANVTEFAKAEYGIDKTQVSRFIHINDKFSAGGYSPELMEEYQGFGYAKLSLMLQLPDSVNEALSPDYSKSEIQDIKNEIDAENSISEIEVMLEKKDDMQQTLENNLKKAVFQLGKDAPDLYERLWTSAVKDHETGKRLMENLIPAGKATYSVRIPGSGRFMLWLKEDDDKVRLMNIRSPEENEEYTKDDLEKAFRDIFSDCGTWKKSWEDLYGGELPGEKGKVAPVQQKVAPRKESKVIVPEKTGPKKNVPEITENVPKNAGTVPKAATAVQSTLHDVNPEIPAPDPKRMEDDVPEEKPDVQQDASEQIQGQDDITQHPEYMPEQKGTGQMIADAKMIISAVKVSMEGWKEIIPLEALRNILKRTEKFVEILEELEKYSAEEEKE